MDFRMSMHFYCLRYCRLTAWAVDKSMGLGRCQIEIIKSRYIGTAISSHWMTPLKASKNHSANTQVKNGLSG